VLKQVLTEAAQLVLAGVVLGGIAAHFLTRLISALLFGVSANDAPTYVAVSVRAWRRGSASKLSSCPPRGTHRSHPRAEGSLA
jgi:ABC-type antimicrobial peptide transport system permease subunit